MDEAVAGECVAVLELLGMGVSITSVNLDEVLREHPSREMIAKAIRQPRERIWGDAENPVERKATRPQPASHQLVRNRAASAKGNDKVVEFHNMSLHIKPQMGSEPNPFFFDTLTEIAVFSPLGR